MMTIRRYNTIMVEVTEDGETYNAPKTTASVDGYSIKEYRYGNGVVIESDTDDVQHAEMIADPDIYEQIGGPVPQRISRNQAYTTLRISPSLVNPAPTSMFDDIDTYVNSLDITPPADPNDQVARATWIANVGAYTAWKEEPYFERLSPAINTLGSTLGISQDALDDLFRSAAAFNI